MDTLSRDITRRFFASEDGFETLQRHWRGMINSSDTPRLLAAHHLLYQVARGKDFRRGFTLPTNPVKLANGQLDGCGLRLALQAIKDAVRYPEGFTATTLLAPFGETITPETLVAIARRLPSTDHGYVRTVDLEIGYVEPEVPSAA